MAIHTESIAYRDGETELTGQLASDDSQANPRPGILVVHGGAGLDEHARGRARRLAEPGFVGFACDMYGNGIAGSRDRVLARITELRANPTRLCQRASAGIQVLSCHPLVDGRIAAVGYCFGGMTVLELARSGMELTGVVSLHGSLETSRPAQPGTIKAKILVCHGALDPHVPIPHVTAFIEEMNSSGANWQMIIYGAAMHGFTHDVGAYGPGVAYHAESDARSMAAIEGFFTELFAGDENSAKKRI